jgi:hypothetical protein
MRRKAQRAMAGPAGIEPFSILRAEMAAAAP